MAGNRLIGPKANASGSESVTITLVAPFSLWLVNVILYFRTSPTDGSHMSTSLDNSRSIPHGGGAMMKKESTSHVPDPNRAVTKCSAPSAGIIASSVLVAVPSIGTESGEPGTSTPSISTITSSSGLQGLPYVKSTLTSDSLPQKQSETRTDSISKKGISTSTSIENDPEH